MSKLLQCHPRGPNGASPAEATAFAVDSTHCADEVDAGGYPMGRVDGGGCREPAVRGHKEYMVLSFFVPQYLNESYYHFR